MKKATVLVTRFLPLKLLTDSRLSELFNRLWRGETTLFWGSVFFGVLVLTSCNAAPRAHVPEPPDLPKNIILFIGDGLGPQQIGLLEASQRRDSAPSATGSGLLDFAHAARLGIHLPLALDTLTNDSACSATQLGSGCSCRPQQVGIDHTGAHCPSFLELARARGLRTGIVSDTRITHATPASFGAHIEDRGGEPEIAQAISSSGVDILLSGGADYFIPKGASSELLISQCPSLAAKSERPDSLDLIKDMTARGYSLACSRDQLQGIAEPPVIGLFAPSHMADAFSEGSASQPTLADMTSAALRLADNPNGFVLMVESGQIDWAGHDNDAGWLLAEMKRAGRALDVINAFVAKNPQTLAIVTGDHETGGFGFSYMRAAKDEDTDRSYLGTRLDYGRPDDIRALSRARFPLRHILTEFFRLPPAEQTPERLASSVTNGAGIPFTPEEARRYLACIDTGGKKPQVNQTRCPQSPFYPYSDLNLYTLLSQTLSPKVNVAWSTGAHTSTPVLVFAKGPGSELFADVMESQEFGRRLVSLVADR